VYLSNKALVCSCIL